MIEQLCENWSELPETIRHSLIEWLNHAPSRRDKERLLKLYNTNRFWAWPCLLCEKPCVHAEPTREEWDHFQNASDDLDMTFFGNPEVYTQAALMSMCNSCRCYKCGTIPDGSPAWEMCEALDK